MTRSMVKLSLVTALAAAAGCSDSGSWTHGPLFVQGTVSSSLSVDNGRAVAMGEDGTTIWAPLDSERDFTLLLPVGHSYEIFLTSGLPDGSEMKVGHLVLPAASGTTTWLGANEQGTVDLGVLHPESSGALTVDWGTEGNHTNDPHCHQGGSMPGGGMCSGMCSGSNEWALQPTKDPGSRCTDHWGHGGGQGNGNCPPCPPQHGDGGVVEDGSTGGGVPTGGECSPDAGLDCQTGDVCDPNSGTCVTAPPNQ
jgi:hypothetical protein